jgi:hypothetical protein
MSSAKFASITAGLLARKGEARPWAQQNALAPEFSWHGDLRTGASSPPPSPPAKDRSCSVRMSAHDYERLGILAVKSNVTRQQLLKDALNQFLAAKAQAYACACLGDCDRSCSTAD